MSAHLGAHETMEVHEVLSTTIDGINQLQLYRQHVKDPQLGSIIDRQLQFAVGQYNSVVQAVGQQRMEQAIPYRQPRNVQPLYGLRSPSPQSPNTSGNELDDRDVSSGVLGLHKCSALTRMVAALECANPQIRQMILQGANDCAQQAYEVWQYMNQKGYYQVPTMAEQTTNTLIHSYAPVMGAAVQGQFQA